MSASACVFASRSADDRSASDGSDGTCELGSGSESEMVGAAPAAGDVDGGGGSRGREWSCATERSTTPASESQRSVCSRGIEE